MKNGRARSAINKSLGLFRQLSGRIGEKVAQSPSAKTTTSNRTQAFWTIRTASLISTANGIFSINGSRWARSTAWSTGTIWLRPTSCNGNGWGRRAAAWYRYDSHGVYSGSGFVRRRPAARDVYRQRPHGKMGKGAEPDRCRMEADGSFTKFLPPAISPAIRKATPTTSAIPKSGSSTASITPSTVPNVTTNRHDPDVSLKDALEWELMGEVDAGLPDFGYMWECPDLFEIDGKTVLLFSPQGIEPEGDRYHNIFRPAMSSPMISGWMNWNWSMMASRNWMPASISTPPRPPKSGWPSHSDGLDGIAGRRLPDRQRRLGAPLPDIAARVVSRDGNRSSNRSANWLLCAKEQALSESGLLSEAKHFERSGANCYELQLDVAFPATADHAPVTLDLCEDAANDKRFRITLDPNTKKSRSTAAAAASRSPKNSARPTCWRSDRWMKWSFRFSSTPVRSKSSSTTAKAPSPPACSRSGRDRPVARGRQHNRLQPRTLGIGLKRQDLTVERTTH